MSLKIRHRFRLFVFINKGYLKYPLSAVYIDIKFEGRESAMKDNIFKLEAKLALEDNTKDNKIRVQKGRKETLKDAHFILLNN